MPKKLQNEKRAEWKRDDPVEYEKQESCRQLWLGATDGARTRSRTRRLHYITTPTNTTKGLALCHRVILDSVTPQRVPAMTPTVHWGRYDGRPWVAAPRDKTKTTTRPRLQRHSLGTKHGSGAARRSHGKQDFVGLQHPERGRTRCQHNRSAETASRQEHRHRAITEDECIPQEKINQVIEHIKNPQNPYTDKVADVSVSMQRQFPQTLPMHRKSWRRRPDK